MAGRCRAPDRAPPGDPSPDSSPLARPPPPSGPIKGRAQPLARAQQGRRPSLAPPLAGHSGNHQFGPLFPKTELPATFLASARASQTQSLAPPLAGPPPARPTSPPSTAAPWNSTLRFHIAKIKCTTTFLTSYRSFPARPPHPNTAGAPPPVIRPTAGRPSPRTRLLRPSPDEPRPPKGSSRAPHPFPPLSPSRRPSPAPGTAAPNPPLFLTSARDLV